MRARTRLTTTTLGVLMTAGLAVGVGVAQTPHETAQDAVAAPTVDATATASARLDRLDAQADAAGVAAQRADEALLQHRDATTEAAASKAHAALESLAERQEPQLAALSRVLGPEVVAAGGEEQAASETTATTAALVASSRARRAVSFARSQKGKPYRYAGSGLGAYDCSGLTMRSYSVAGRSIGGHSANAQYQKARSQHRLVSYRSARPGDLIFYGRPGAVYHVAMYSGNGRMIEAPYPGKRVREVAVRSASRLGQVARPAG